MRSARQSARAEAGRAADPQRRNWPCHGWQSVVDKIDASPAGRRFLAWIAQWELEHANDWEPGSCGSPPAGSPFGSWAASFTRIGDGKRVCVLVRGYPDRVVYTDAELAKFQV